MSVTFKKFQASNLGAVLRIMADKPITSADLSKQTNIGLETSREMCKSLHRHGLAYIHHFAANDCGHYVPAYHLGTGVDAKHEDKISKSQYQMIEILKRHTPRYMTAIDLAYMLEMAPRTVHERLKQLEGRGLIIGSETNNMNPKRHWRYNPNATIPNHTAYYVSPNNKPKPTTQNKPPKKQLKPQSWFSVVGNI